MSEIRVETFTGDPALAQAAAAHWSQDEQHAFRFKVAPIAASLCSRVRNVAPRVAKASIAFVPEWPCRSCGGRRPLANREDYVRGRAGPYEWLCNACLERRQAEVATARRAAIRRCFPALPDRAASRLTLMDRVYLMSFARLAKGGPENPSGAVAQAYPPLSPTPFQDRLIVERLHAQRLIQVAPESDLSAFDWDEDGRPEAFDPLHVSWLIASQPEPEAPLVPFQREHEFASALQLCRAVLIQECFQYLEFTLAEHRLAFRPGRGTHDLFERLIADLSVAQIYRLIWRSAKDTAAFAERQRLTPDHAGATVINQLAHTASYLLSRELPVDPYRRDWRVPRSRLSEVLFDELFPLGAEAPFAARWSALEETIAAMILPPADAAAQDGPG
ncbi:hypothetical protein [Longimicrobium sp.]|uniref:hypothetical protein n=1 Tax=Longimicrobium sp. TaxID=2029185 RepID=UPI003B3B5633